MKYFPNVLLTGENLPLSKTNESSTSTSVSSYSKLKSTYQNFLKESENLFPKVDQKLILNMLQLEMSYPDWEGSVMLKVIYPANTDLESKKEWVYKKYQRVASIEENKTIRFKGIRIYIKELESMIREDLT
jgi:hypothetical protein